MITRRIEDDNDYCHTMVRPTEEEVNFLQRFLTAGRIEDDYCHTKGGGDLPRRR